MTSDGADMSPAEVGLFLVETLLNLVVGALLLVGAATVVVWFVRRDVPVGLLVTTLVLGLSFVIVESRHSQLRKRLQAATARPR